MSNISSLRRRGCWLLLTLPLWSCGVHAETPLARFIDAAMELRDGEALASARREVGHALQRKSEALFADAPSASVKYQTDQVGSDLGYREWEGGIEMPLWLPGQSDAYSSEARSAYDVSDATVDARRLEMAGEVRARLWQGVIARTEMRQAEAALDLARDLDADVARRVNAGELPRGDRLLAAQELLKREEAATDATRRFEMAAREFRLYTGMDIPVAVDAEIPSGLREVTEAHPRLRLAMSEAGRARAYRNRVDGERAVRPNLWLGAKTARAAIGNDYESAVGIELSIPFGSGAHTGTALAEAEAGLTESELAMKELRLGLENALDASVLELDRLTDTLANTARRRALADERLALNRRAFELGETDLVYLLQAQADALAARHDQELRGLERSQAVARLNQALGVMP